MSPRRMTGSNMTILDHVIRRGDNLEKFYLINIPSLDATSL